MAFDRGGAVTVATRLPLGLLERGGWGDTRLALPEGRWRDLLTDRGLETGLRPSSTSEGPLLATLLSAYPVALLVRED